MKFRSFYDDYEYEVKPQKVAVYDKNVQLTTQQVEEIATSLLTKLVDNKNVFGYMTQDKSGNSLYCKWNKEKEVFVIYTFINGERKVISKKIKSFREYNGDKAAEYFDEIPTGK